MAESRNRRLAEEEEMRDHEPWAGVDKGGKKRRSWPPEIPKWRRTPFLGSLERDRPPLRPLLALVH